MWNTPSQTARNGWRDLEFQRKPKYLSRLGKELDAEAGRDAVYTAALNVLAVAREHLGSLDRVSRVVRLGVFLAVYGDFFDHPKVADAASDLFRDVFGIEKMSVRSVIGVVSLPLGVPVIARCHLRSCRAVKWRETKGAWSEFYEAINPAASSYR